jgi:hypothetical protein
MQHDVWRRPSRKDKQAIEVRKAIAVLVTVCLVAAGIGYAYITTHKDIRPVDGRTFCPTDEKGPNSVTAILIDRTDSFSLTQQAAIRDRLNDVKDHMSRYDLVEVYSVEPTQTKLLQPQFSMCSPGRGEDTNDWTGNPHLIEERWKNLFDAPLNNLFNSILSSEVARISPIMESIQSIAVTRLESEKLVSKKIPRRLIIISDLIQYVKDYSQYRPFRSFNQFRDTPYYQSVRSDLSDIHIEIWYIRRHNTLALQGEKHIDFWRDYIADQGGLVDKVWYVPGT